MKNFSSAFQMKTQNQQGQRKISSFFSPRTVTTTSNKGKRLSSAQDESGIKVKACKEKSKENIDNVKVKSSTQKTITSSCFSASMSTTNNKGIGSSWKAALHTELQKPYYQQLCKYVAKERNSFTIYPPESQIFSWTHYCDIRDVKVVILGQDPYHGPGQAHGLCFSVQTGIAPPPSLINIYKELENDISGFSRPVHGNLSGWAVQGVLLLNAILTVRASQASSHKGQGWETFTDAVVTWLNLNLSGVVFILWGAYAQKKGSRINIKKHRVLKGVHPSPLSAHRGFFGCKHFSKANEYLVEKGKPSIDWNALSK